MKESVWYEKACRWRPYLSYKEIFARCYTQYIALHDQSGIVREQFIQLMEDENIELYPVQWEAADFEPIAQAIEAVFQQKGWR